MLNEKIKVVIVEDEFAIAEDIGTCLVDSGYEILSTFDRGETAFLFVLEMCPDIVLVDIQLSGTMDGIELVEKIRTRINLPIIYITANSDAKTYARAKSTKPHAFLVKPFTPSNLLAAVDLALHHFSIEKTPELIERPVLKEQADTQFVINQCLFIRTNGKYRKICSDDLLFIEAAGSYVHIQSQTERYTLSQNLAHFQKKTPLPNLVRIHRSYVVNIDHVDSFEESFVFVQNHKLPLGDNHRAEFLSRVHLL